MAVLGQDTAWQYLDRTLVINSVTCRTRLHNKIAKKITDIAGTTVNSYTMMKLKQTKKNKNKKTPTKKNRWIKSGGMRSKAKRANKNKKNKNTQPID